MSLSRPRISRPTSLRWHLVALIVGAVVPIAAFAAFTARQLAAGQRAAAERRLVQSAHDLAALLDREMESTFRALGTLARSERLEQGDLPAFHTELTRALSTQTTWAAVILLAPDGRQLANTAIPFGQPLPRVNEPDSLRQVVATTRPSVGSLVRGDPGGILAFPVRVPVTYAGAPRYVLTAVIEPKSVADLMTRQKLVDDEWTRSVVDARGTIVARTRNPEAFVGRTATPSFHARIRAKGEGVTRSTTLDGQEVYSGFSRSGLSDWTGVVVVPVEMIDGPSRRYQLGLAAAGLAMLALGVTGALLVSRRVTRGIASAAHAADALAESRPVDVPPSAVAEIDHLGQALHRSADLLARRQRERDELLSKANTARADAEAASRAKDEFLAMLGHELRNPLAPIRTGAHLLATLPPDEPRLAEVRETIARQAAHMTRLVDDLLDASRVARGKVGLDLRPLDLREVVRQVTSDLRPQFDQVRIALDTALPDAPVVVDGDHTRLAQCLGNLLHNALKFTPAGGHARVDLTCRDGFAHLAVHDDGAGIAPDLLPRLFTPFNQGPQSLDRTRGGLGLGLALVRGFVALHGGTVAARSDGPGQGATFTVTLPLAAHAVSPPPRPAAPPMSASRPAGPRRRVLLVEDLADAAKVLKLLLTVDGHDVRVAGTAAEALSAARAFAPDVVLCDIGLPDMDGYDLCRRLRDVPQLANARLVALTGYGQADDVARATAAGFDLHLTKPVDVAMLRSVVAAAATPGPAHPPADAQ